jgi:hypothetical protein
MIQTLAITIILEGFVCFLYAVRQRKPVRPILLTSVLANLITQSLLWIALNLFYQHYLVTLLVAEIFIWAMESYLLFCFRFNQLKVPESLFLSLLMNLSSFGIGWFLPI